MLVPHACHCREQMRALSITSKRAKPPCWVVSKAPRTCQPARTFDIRTTPSTRQQSSTLILRAMSCNIQSTSVSKELLIFRTKSTWEARKIEMLSPPNGENSVRGSLLPNCYLPDPLLRMLRNLHARSRECRRKITVQPRRHVATKVATPSSI